MKTKTKVALLLVVFMGSIGTTLVTNADGYLHTIAQYPAIASLFWLLALIVLDEMRFQKIVRQKELESIGSLFAGGHYAVSIYDKHIEFCEAYWQRSLEIVKELFTKGEFPELVHRANTLYTFRLEHALWLTEQMNQGLEGFEQALRSMGAAEHYLKHLPVGEKRSEVVDQSFNTFNRVMVQGIEPGQKEDPTSYIAVLKELQKILGIAEAYEIRKKTLEKMR